MPPGATLYTCAVGFLASNRFSGIIVYVCFAQCAEVRSLATASLVASAYSLSVGVRGTAFEIQDVGQ